MNLTNLCHYANGGTPNDEVLPELAFLPEKVREAYNNKLKKEADDAAERIADDIMVMATAVSADKRRVAGIIRELKSRINNLKKQSAKRDLAYNYAVASGNWIPLALHLGLVDVCTIKANKAVAKLTSIPDPETWDNLKSRG